MRCAANISGVPFSGVPIFSSGFNEFGVFSDSAAHIGSNLRFSAVTRKHCLGGPAVYLTCSRPAES